VAATVKVELTRAVDAHDLQATLEQRGLFVRPLDGSDYPIELEVSYSTDETARLSSDVCAALEAWVSERELPLVPTPLDGEGFGLRPPAD
jgi:hypothetical protein